jgi:hypothetical protein
MAPVIRKHKPRGRVSAVGGEGVCPAWLASILFPLTLRRLMTSVGAQNSSGMVWKAMRVGAALKAVSMVAGARVLRPYL